MEPVEMKRVIETTVWSAPEDQFTLGRVRDLLSNLASDSHPHDDDDLLEFGWDSQGTYVRVTRGGA